MPFALAFRAVEPATGLSSAGPIGEDAGVAISAAEAADVRRQALGDMPEGDRVEAHAVADSDLWSVTPMDSQGRPYAGSAMFVGPDRRLWTLSSNPGIHDTELATSLLAAAYREHLTDRLDETLFAERVGRMTAEGLAAKREFMTDLVGGALRTPVKRSLP